MAQLKDLKNLIIPLMAEQALATLSGLLNSVMVAGCGETVVSGISLVDQINILMLGIFSAVSTGATVLIAQYIGKQDKKSADDAMAQSVVFSFFLSLLFTLPLLLQGNRILGMIFGTLEQGVFSSASLYLTFVSLSIPATAVYAASAGGFRATGETKLTMVISLFSTLLHAGLNGVLIFGFRLGATGAGLSLLISKLLGMLLILRLLFSGRFALSLRGMFPFCFDGVMLKKILFIGLPAGAEKALFQGGKILSQRFVVLAGTTHIAASVAANNIVSFLEIPANALSLAIVTVIGQLIGADNKEKAQQTLVRWNYWTCAAFLLSCGIGAAFTDNLIGLYSFSPEAFSLAKTNLYLFYLFAPVFWSPSFFWPSGMRAAGDVKFTMIVSISTMAVCRIGLGYLLAVVFQMGLTGVWIGMIADWISRSVIYGFRLRGGKWIRPSLV